MVSSGDPPQANCYHWTSFVNTRGIKQWVPWQVYLLRIEAQLWSDPSEDWFDWQIAEVFFQLAFVRSVWLLWCSCTGNTKPIDVAVPRFLTRPLPRLGADAHLIGLEHPDVLESLIHTRFTWCSGCVLIGRTLLGASFGLASGWDVPCAFVFLLNTGCSMCFCFFAEHRMFHMLLLFCWTQDVPHAFVFLLNTGYSMCFWIFCWTQDVPHAFVFLLNTRYSMCFCFFAEHRMFHVLLFFCWTQDVPHAFVILLNTGCSTCFCCLLNKGYSNIVELKYKQKTEESIHRYVCHWKLSTFLQVTEVTVAKEHLIKIQAWLVFSLIHSVLVHTYQFRAWLGWPARPGVHHSIGKNAMQTSQSWPKAGLMRNRRRDVLQPDQMCVRPGASILILLGDLVPNHPYGLWIQNPLLSRTKISLKWLSCFSGSRSLLQQAPQERHTTRTAVFCRGEVAFCDTPQATNLVRVLKLHAGCQVPKYEFVTDLSAVEQPRSNFVSIAPKLCGTQLVTKVCLCSLSGGTKPSLKQWKLMLCARRTRSCGMGRHSNFDGYRAEIKPVARMLSDLWSKRCELQTAFGASRHSLHTMNRKNCACGGVSRRRQGTWTLRNDCWPCQGVGVSVWESDHWYVG